MPGHDLVYDGHGLGLAVKAVTAERIVVESVLAVGESYDRKGLLILQSPHEAAMQPVEIVISGFKVGGKQADFLLEDLIGENPGYRLIVDAGYGKRVKTKGSVG
jgi:hypothetical protein